MYQTLMELDPTGFVEKQRKYLDGIGFAQSLYDYNLIKLQIENFLKEGVPSKAWNRNYKAALRSIKAEVQKAHLSVIRYKTDQDIINVIPKKDTHAGFDFVLTGKKKKGEYFDDIFNFWCTHIEKALEEGTFNMPIMIGTRTQASGAYDDEGNCTGTFKAKSRLVSMIALRVILAELMFAKPFQNWLAETEWYAGGKADPRINAEIQRLRSKGYHMLTVDYSNYDQSIPAWLIKDAFDVVREAFKGGDFDEEIWEIIVHDFIYKVFIDADLNCIFVNKGVPSGSMFTQIIDSVVNRLMVTTYLFSLDCGARKAREKTDRNIEYLSDGGAQREAASISSCSKMLIMGDDNLIFTPWKVDVHDLSGYLLTMFGIIANPDKCKYTKPYGYPEFLSRVWTPAGVYRTPEVLVSKLLFPERFRNYKANPNFKPEQIIYAFYLTYPLGMTKFLNVNTLKDMYRTKSSGDGKAWNS